MKNETTRKVINVDKLNMLPLWGFKEGDDVVLKLSLYKDALAFDITGQTISLGARTQKGLIEQLSGFTINKNELDIALKNSILVPGIVEIELNFRDVSGNMTTASFFITVNSKILNDTAVEATNEFDTFTRTVEVINADYNSLKGGLIATDKVVYFQNEINKTNEHLEQRALQSDLIVERERINNLISLGNGVDNAETADVRVALDGIVYGSAGDSVRNQNRQIRENIINGFNKGYKSNYSDSCTFESGGINNTGSKFDDVRFIRTKTYLNSNIKEIKILDTDYIFIIIRYNKENVFMDRISSLTEYTDFNFIDYNYKLVLYHKNFEVNPDSTFYNKIDFLDDKLEVFDNINEFIKPKSIDIKQTNFIKHGKNMLLGKIVQGHYIDWQTGNPVVNGALNYIDYIPVEPNTRISLNKHNALAFYDENHKFVAGINGDATKSKNYTLVDGEILGTRKHGTYTVPTNAYCIGISFIPSDTDLQLELGEESTEYVKPCVYIDDFYYPENTSSDTNMTEKNKFIKSSNVCTITTPKAKYIFKKVTDSSINIDTWRLYEGKLIDSDGTEYTMWTNSDAEGAIKLKDEEDFVCGFHGDELCTDIHIIIDGVILDMSQDFDLTFDDLTIIVNSDVYHCNTSANSGVKAFERVKTLNFSNNKVSIANRFVCAKSVTITRAALMLFQCYKKQGETKILNSFWNNNDLKYWVVPETTGTMPVADKNMTQAKFFTNVGVIDFKATRGIENEHYIGAITNFSDQNRLKIYFDYIDESFGEVNYNLNDVLLTEFEFTIS